MDIDRLTKDELDYELLVRGVKSTKTVAENRVTLRKLISLENTGKFIQRSPLKLNWGEELERVTEKLDTLELMLKDKTTQPSKKKLDTTLTHIMGRVGRIEEETAEIGELKSALVQRILTAWEEVDPTLGSTSTSSLRAETAPSDPIALPDNAERLEPGPSGVTKKTSTSDVEWLTGYPGPERKLIPDTVAEQPPSALRPESTRVFKSQVPIKDWGVTFRGDGTGISLRSFLDDVDHYRRARNASYTDIFEGAIDFFAGPALVWYKSIHRDVRSWRELENFLRDEFEDEDYGEELMREIHNRTQGVDEKFSTYIAVMKTYFDRLPTPIKEEKKVKILRKNVSPYFYERLSGLDLSSVEDLLQAGRRIQRDREHMEKFRPPPSAKRTLLEPDLAYETPRREKLTEVVVDDDPRDSPRNSPRPSTPTTSGTGNINCWHCNESGHRFQGCPKLKIQFCTRCGTRELRDGRCVRCQTRFTKNLNSKGSRN